MAAEADVTFLVEEARVVLVVNGVGVVLAAVGSYVVALAGFADVALGYHGAIDRYLNIIALGYDFLGMPCADGTEVELLGDVDAIDGAVVLVGSQVLVDVGHVVEHLDFHAFVSGVNTVAGAETDTVVHTYYIEAEFEAIDEVAVLLVGVEVAIAAVVGRNVDVSVNGNIAGGVAVPLLERAAVEEDFEALLFLLGRECEDRRGSELLHLGAAGLHR